MSAVARLGDLIGHGTVEGRIITAAIDTSADGIPIARVGDKAFCSHPIAHGAVHGLQTIITGSPGVTCEGAAVARVGDLISCGAVIITGSTTAVEAD